MSDTLFTSSRQSRQAWDAAHIGVSMRWTSTFKTHRTVKMTDLKYPPLPSKYTGLTPFYNSSHRERDDDYRKVLANFSPRWRVIICKDNIQMILQRRSVSPPNTGTWAGRKYCMTRKGLTVACSRFELISQDDVERLFHKFQEHQLCTSAWER